MNNLKNKIKNTKINFSGNFFRSIIIPCAVAVLAVIIGVACGFNKGFDFNGGLLVSVVAETADFSEASEYNEFKATIDDILSDNGVKGSIYLKEKDETTFNDVLVIKIAVEGSKEEIEKLAVLIKSDIVSEFYAETDAEEIELRHLVSVSEFGASYDVWNVLSAILIGLFVVLSICIYIYFRAGINAAMLTLAAGIAGNMFTFALAVITRVELNAFSLAVIPFVGIISALSTFIFAKRAEKLAKSDEFQRKSNFVLANEAVKKGLFSTLLIATASCLVALVFAMANIFNPVLGLGLLIFEAIVAICYVQLFIVPAIFGATFIRRFKKEKVKKQKETDSLKQEEVLKETDLDNLVSN